MRLQRNSLQQNSSTRQLYTNLGQNPNRQDLIIDGYNKLKKRIDRWRILIFIRKLKTDRGIIK